MAIEELLRGRAGKHASPVLRNFAPSNVPATIVLPEYALGFPDWVAVDDAVRACAQPVLLVVGFGATLAQPLIQWSQGAGATKRILSWDEAQTPLAPARPVNGAFCWVHLPQQDTACIALIKNHLEQSTEAVALSAMQEGVTLLHLRFNDIDVFPMICADLVRPIADPASAQRRLQSYLASAAPGRAMLLIGSLLQQQQNPNWTIALDQWLNVTTAGRPAVLAIANAANGAFTSDEARDKWRSMSGVLGRFTDLPKHQRNVEAARAVNEAGVTGAVVRQTGPCIVGGGVAWAPYTPTADAFIWRASFSSLLDGQGIVAPIKGAGDIAKIEVSRFASRYPPQPEWCPRVSAGMAAIVAHLDSGAEPGGRSLMQSLLHGVDSGGAVDPDGLHFDTISFAMRKAIYALATLQTHVDLEWQGEVLEQGQLALSGSFNVLVWRDTPAR